MLATKSVLSCRLSLPKKSIVQPRAKLAQVWYREHWARDRRLVNFLRFISVASRRVHGGPKET